MTVVAIVPAVVCLVGLLLWALGPRFKWSLEPLPAIMFGAGLLVWLAAIMGETIRIG